MSHAVKRTWVSCLRYMPAVTHKASATIIVGSKYYEKSKNHKSSGSGASKIALFGAVVGAALTQSAGLFK